ncbi:MAG: SDR family oxidoreductase [Gemmatimonadetes bacterium]|uniref:SDR family oxidoreductase n=1 Tax=Candidatus Kutchimonas denitrificans TaxID=3056748 RepID=A0AAE5CCT1_9BACT|nr:SDR family oxidoreductase [Gemmatimonadota bacterium]NIR76095.1 SDR family oxidoreductase [Candidatus Kutchimonas denitrificans]NIS00474.1 SDR family oxidoreductase [Gemmatimonadota bacterium]NIT66132.1 SDR family oxidoreductase [Gemmatimonadota bacterium]NIU54210.1 SDR family oxidoreductase [Gemmatimonadota bacterium]
MDLGIESRVAAVGGASMGLGKAIAWALAREGARVAICARGADRLERAATAINRASGREVFPYPVDLATPTGPAEFVDSTVKNFGKLDILVTNAGGPPATISSKTPPEAWEEALQLNLLSTVRLAQAALPYMRRGSWGRIICVTSVSVKSPLPGMALSNTARPGVVGYAKTIAEEFAQNGITVNVVCPGYMATDRVSELMAHRAEEAGTSVEKVSGDLVANIPAGRMGDPKELGDLVAFLASERAAYITGTTLQIDGGFVRGLL